MKILLLNQAFFPDVASTAQHLSDLAVGLADRGHQVTVVASRRSYDNPSITYPKFERWRGIEIHRVWCTRFGKGAKWKRAADFASFLICCVLRLLTLPRAELVVALTSPPLISFIGSSLAQIKRSRFAYWVMDLNPDEAIEAGWLRPESWLARFLHALSRSSLRRAEKIIVLDRFMRDRVLAKGIDARRVVVLPPWAHDDEVRFDPQGRSEFRKAHGLEDKFVVMYSGNHSPCHPLTTVLEAAKRLRHEGDIAFCFVGGGSEFAKVRQFAETHQLKNITCLPYQPLKHLAASLSAADLHVVIMGNPFVGTIHPCKVYNILQVNSPFLYIGPARSHVADIVGRLNGQATGIWIEHGDVDKLVGRLAALRATRTRLGGAAASDLARGFSKDTLLPRMIAELEER